MTFYLVLATIMETPIQKIIAISLSASMFCTFTVPSIAADPSKTMRQLQPAIQLPKGTFFDGEKSISLNTFKGNYVLINFWATWCAPCIEEMPSLDRLAGKLANEKFIVVAVSQDEAGASLVKPFVQKLKLSKIRILYDQDKKSFREYALRGLPTSVLVSPNGQIIARLEGSAEWDQGELYKQIYRQISIKPGSKGLDSGNPH